jgi:DNA excision repair protein ERCC-4
MIVIIDTREHAPYTFEGYDAQTERGTLATGDYSLAGFLGSRSGRIEIKVSR